MRTRRLENVVVIDRVALKYRVFLVVVGVFGKNLLVPSVACHTRQNANFGFLYGINPLLIIYKIVHKPEKSEAQVNKHHQNQGYATEGNLLLSLEIFITI